MRELTTSEATTERDAPAGRSWTATHLRQPQVRRVLATAWPTVLTAVVLCLSLLSHAAIHGFRRMTDFVEIGHTFGHPLGLDALATSPIGYDGQYYYFMARFPGQVPPGAFTWPALYYSRALYPLLARLLAFGSVELIPWMLLGINFAAIVGAVALIANVLQRRGQPLWLALIPGLYCGQPMAMLRDLSDPLFVFWLACALFGVARGRWLLAAAALGLGMLTREATLVFVIAFALPLLFKRAWNIAATFFAVSLLPYAAWQVAVRIALGTWGVGQSSHVNVLLPLPFAGLASAPNLATGIVLFALTCIPAVGAILLGIRRLLERPQADTLVIAAAAGAVAYGFLILVQPGVHWLDLWEPMRLAAPLAVLVPLLVRRGRRTALSTGLCGFMLASVLLALMV